MGERRIALEKTKIGSPYVIAALDELRAHRKAPTHCRLGSQRRIFDRQRYSVERRHLTALPTRDATLPILANLFAAAEQRIGLAALWNRLPARFGRAGLLDNLPVAVSQAILAHLIPPGDAIEVEFDARTAYVDRSRPMASRTPLAGSAAKDWQQCQATLVALLHAGARLRRHRAHQRARRRAPLFPQRRHRAYPAVGQCAAAAHLCEQRVASARRSHRRAWPLTSPTESCVGSNEHLHKQRCARRERIPAMRTILDSNPSRLRIDSSDSSLAHRDHLRLPEILQVSLLLFFL